MSDCSGTAATCRPAAGLDREPSSEAVRLWMEFIAKPTGSYLADEQRLGRLLDYAVIVPRLQRLYEWSAGELGQPGLLGLVREGNPTYAWPYEDRHVWRAPAMPFVGRALARATRPTGRP